MYQEKRLTLGGTFFLVDLVRAVPYTSNMPYINQDSRVPLDEMLVPLIAHLQQLPLEQQDGALNYVITRTLKALYEPKYFHYNRAMGVLGSVQAEWYRRDVAPYEDRKISENGDVS